MSGRPFQVGDTVRKRKGYKYPGVIVSAFETLEGLAANRSPRGSAD